MDGFRPEGGCVRKDPARGAMVRMGSNATVFGGI